MKIKSIEAIEVDLNKERKKKPGAYRTGDREPASPMARYPAYQGKRSSWTSGARWPTVVCVITAEDGTFGIGTTSFAGPVVRIIQDHFGPHLVGESCLATEKMFDMMCRMATPFGGPGLASYAISAVDLALWDLKGKLLQQPVYALLGGPQKERIFCYATGFDVDWYLELGFQAVKLPMPYSPVDGLEGLRKAEELVASAREKMGDDAELMLDCWMALDVEYTVRMAEMLKPYRLKWIEDYLLPEDLEGFEQVRKRLPGQGLATGEHWYLPQTFATAVRRGLVDIFQPDVLWVGGISSCLRICYMAEANGLSVITHGGMNWPYGQHLAFAMPSIPWGERSGGVAPAGVQLEEVVAIPGTAVIQDGYLVPSDAPGFGIEVDLDWLEKVAV